MLCTGFGILVVVAEAEERGACVDRVRRASVLRLSTFVERGLVVTAGGLSCCCRCSWCSCGGRYRRLVGAVGVVVVSVAGGWGWWVVAGGSPDTEVSTARPAGSATAAVRQSLNYASDSVSHFTVVEAQFTVSHRAKSSSLPVNEPFYTTRSDCARGSAPRAVVCARTTASLGTGSAERPGAGSAGSVQSWRRQRRRGRGPHAAFPRCPPARPLPAARLPRPAWLQKRHLDHAALHLQHAQPAHLLTEALASPSPPRKLRGRRCNGQLEGG